MNSGNVFLVDDDAPTLKAMSRLLQASGFAVLGFRSANEFLLHHDMQTPGCAVLDVGLGNVNAVDIYRDLVNRGCKRPTIFITGRPDVLMSVRAMKSGAVDFLTKPVMAQDLIAGIRKAIQIDRQSRQEEDRLSELRCRISSLTPRQHEVLAYVLTGRQSKEIAADMRISEKTVKIHRGQILAKMGFSTSVDLIRALIPRLDFEELIRRAYVGPQKLATRATKKSLSAK